MGDLDIRMTAGGAKNIAAKFITDSVELPLAIGAIVATETLLLQGRVKGRASGRPGPNAPTGDYRRSISARVTRAYKGAVTTGEVGTNRPQGRRLELGFHGTDSLGRHFNQPAFEHFGPAVDETDGPFQRKLDAVIGRL
jgi:hypothetical protein